MKTSSNELHLLIKSMTTSEKKYFRKNANSAQGDKIYLRLFNEIEKQEKYDENKIKIKFKGEQFLKQLSVSKNNLYFHILRSLNQISISGNAVFGLQSGLISAEILFNKGLVWQANKLISRLKTTALKFEEFEVLLQLINLEKNIMLKSFQENIEKLEDISVEETKITEKRKKLIQYQILYYKAFRLITKYGHIRNSEEEKTFNEIIKSEYLINPDMADSLKAKIHYHEIFLYYYVSKMDYETAVKYTTKLITLIENNTDYLTAHIDKYLAIYQNHILQYFYLGKFIQTEKEAQKLLTLLNNKKNKIPELIRISSMGKILSIRFVASVNSVNFTEAAKIFQEVKEYIKNYNSIIDNSIKIVLYNISAYFNFAEENYPEALNWINRLLNNPEMKYFVEMSCNAKWFELLVHFEMGNFDYIDNLLKTNKRYLSKSGKMLGTEKLMIKFFTESISNNNPKDIKLFNNIINGLNSLSTGKNKDEHNIDYYNVRAWANSKIQNKSFKDYLLENISGKPDII